MLSFRQLPLALVYMMAVTCEVAAADTPMISDAQVTKTFVGEINSALFSPDGKLFITGGWASEGGAGMQGEIAFWDTSSWAKVGSLAHGTNVESLALTPDGALLVSAAWEKGGEKLTGSLRLWQVATQQEKGVLGRHASPLWTVAVSPDGKTAASGDAGGTVKLWDLASGRERLSFQGNTAPAVCLSFMPSGKVLVVGGGARFKPSTLKCWNVDDGTQCAAIEGCDYQTTALACDRQGRTLAVGGEMGLKQIKLWDLATRTMRVTEGHLDTVSSLAFSKDGAVLIAGSVGGTALLLDVATGQWRLFIVGMVKPILAVAVSPDGNTLVTAGNVGFQVWSLANVIATSGSPAKQ